MHKDTLLHILNPNNIARKPTLMLQETRVKANVSKFSIYKIIEVALIVVLWFLSREVMEAISK